jgi:type II secretory pathway component PulK
MKYPIAQSRLPARRGAIFVLALAVIVILSGLVLVFAQEMRTEALASANRLAYVQAEGVEQGAEQWVLAQVESYVPDAVGITTTNAEALQVGGGYFWILHEDPTQDQTYTFGITDEAGKVNLNYATAMNFQLDLLPGVTDDMVTSISNWIAPNSTDSSYQSLQEPYSAKGGPFESVEELLLITNITPQILYGYDLNHDGIIDANEKNLAGVGSQFSTGTNDTRGLFNYVTCFSQPLPAGSAATSTTSTSTTTTLVNVNNTAQLQTLLTTALPGQASTILSNLQGAPPGGLSLRTFFTLSRIAVKDYGTIADQITDNASAASPLLNVNTASAQAMASLPTLTQADGENLIAARTNADLSNLSWFFTALADSTKVGAVVDAVTDRSYQYSADIVAVSGDGRAYKRVRIIVDASKYPTTPAQIVYRKDLTSLGWPLPPEYRTSLRAGQGVPDSSTTGGTGLKLGMTPG